MGAPELPEARVLLRVQPGDVIVFECDQVLTAEQIDEVVVRAKAVFPDNEVLVLDQMRLTVKREGTD